MGTALEPKTIPSSSFWQKAKRKKVKKSYRERAGWKKERRRRRRGGEVGEIKIQKRLRAS